MRLFIGIGLSQAARREVERIMSIISDMAPGRYVRGDMLHITLAFPGETSESELDSVRAAMEDAAPGISPFELKLSAPGYFGKADNAILYCGTAPSEDLENAAGAVREQLRLRNIAFDPKPFRAHITLARHVRTNPEALRLPVKPVAFAASEFTLFYSHRVNGVLTYTPVYSVGFSRKRSLD